MHLSKSFAIRLAPVLIVSILLTVSRPALAGQKLDDIKVSGTVVDADTHQPLKTFTVTEGRSSPYGNGAQIDWDNARQRPESNGTFTVYLGPQQLQTPPAIAIEADGYLPLVWGVITTDETNLVLALKKGNGREGVVLQPDGEPDASVAVYLTDSDRNGVYVASDQLAVNEDLYKGTRKTFTDASGHFSFQARPDDYDVIVIDPTGFAEVPVGQLEKTRKVPLQKYSRVEGQLMIGSRPGTNEIINLWMAYNPYAWYPRNFPPLSLYLQTHTDGHGKFVFKRVPPVPVQISHQPNIKDTTSGTIPESQTTAILPQPGKTCRVTLGGKGRPVTGRLVVQGYDDKIDYRADVQTISIVLPPPPGLPDLTAMSAAFTEKMRSLTNDEERKAALQENANEWQAAQEIMSAFYRTDAGWKYDTLQHRYTLNFSQDGSFRIEDVPGGKYDLTIELHAPGQMWDPNTVIGRLTKEIVVPDSAGGRSDKPFDLGTVELAARNSLKAGKVAPDFDVKTLDGKPLKLSDFKGKYVLLDFWATWCGPCVAETPNLKAAWDAYKNDPRFTIVSLSLDPKVAQPRDYTAKNGMSWTQGFVGDWSKTDLPTRFGVDGIPSIFLIGPDGKIIARDLRGDAIKTAVATALQSQ